MNSPTDRGVDKQLQRKQRRAPMGATVAAENEAVLAAEDVEDDGQYIQRLEDEQVAA
jgi:hypothetical protein